MLNRISTCSEQLTFVFNTTRTDTIVKYSDKKTDANIGLVKSLQFSWFALLTKP